MGKLLIIIVLLVTVIFTGIIISLQNKSTLIPSLVTSNMAEIKGKMLSNEAIIYSIKQLYEGNISVSESGTSELFTFTDFNILDGTIDSLELETNDTGDTLLITSYVTVNFDDVETKYSSFAKVNYNPSVGFDNVITNSKDLRLTGSANVIGNIEENIDLDFASIFGMTIAQMKDRADNVYINPPNNVSPVDGITYIKTRGNHSVHFTNHHWTGSGILIVDGDFHMTGGTFDGIIWIEGGRFMISGNANVNGTIFVNSEPREQTMVTGNCEIHYDYDIIHSLLSMYNISSSPRVTILSWDN